MSRVCGWATLNSSVHWQSSCFWERHAHQLIRSGTSSATLSPLRPINPPADLGWWDIAGAPKHCLPVLFSSFCLFVLVHPWEHQYSSWNTACFILPSQNCLWSYTCTDLQTILWAAMFSLMQRHKVYMFFVLQGDECINAALFLYNDSNTTFCCQCLIPLVCAEEILLLNLLYHDSMNAHKTEIWMVSSLEKKRSLCIWAWDLLSFFISAVWTLHSNRIIFVICLIKMHKSLQMWHCLRVWFIMETVCFILSYFATDLQVQQNGLGYTLKQQGKKKFAISFLFISLDKRL